MACFMISNNPFFLFTDQPAFSFRTGNDAFDSFLKFALTDHLLISTGGQDCGFIHQVFKIRTNKTWSGTGQVHQIDFRGKRFPFDMDFEDRFSTSHIWAIKHHPAVKTSRSKQRRIENIRPVCCSHDDYIRIGIKTIHFHQHLV